MLFLNGFTSSSRVKYFISIFLLIRMALSAGLTPNYCSNQNTGSGNPPDTSIYQSLGNCQGVCKDTYAFAIVQGQSCWCSNSAPTDQESLNKCSDTCPGYPFETCGNVASGLYNYLALDKATASPSTLPRSSSVTAASPKTTSLLDATVTQEDSATTTKATMSAITTQSLQTIGGSVVTRTVILAPSETSSASSKLPTAKSKMSSGSIVAIAVAVVIAGVVILVAIIFGLCCYRRKKAQRQLDGEDASSTNIQRNTSVLSKAGLLGTANASSNLSGSPERRMEAMSERRSSKLQVFDQRLNPTAFMQHDDGSRSSFVSMQDNRDYTRTLNVRNPDPAD